MKCMLCDKTTRCSCKWGWCPKCNNNNKIVWVMNDLIKLWVEKDTIREEMDLIRGKGWRIDSYTLYEYLTKQIDEEIFNSQVENYKPKHQLLEVKWIYAKVPNWDWINPNKQCVYKKPWIRERCIYCNEIKKFQGDKQCAAYKEKKSE